MTWWSTIHQSLPLGHYFPRTGAAVCLSCREFWSLDSFAPAEGSSACTFCPKLAVNDTSGEERSTLVLNLTEPGKGVIDNKHSTDVESTDRIRVSVRAFSLKVMKVSHTLITARVLVLNDPPARRWVPRGALCVQSWVLPPGGGGGGAVQPVPARRVLRGRAGAARAVR